VLFSRSLELWVGTCRKRGSCKTKIWEPTQRGVQTRIQSRDLSGFRHMRVAASSSGLKGSEILWPSGVGIFHRSDSSLLTSLVDSCAPFFTSCKAMEFAWMGHRQEHPDLPVSLLKVLHVLWLECEKSMELTASSVATDIVGTKRLYQSQSPLELGWRSDRGSRTLCPSMAHSSSDGQVGYIV